MTKRLIGWIKPDDNIRPDHDAYHIEEWLSRRGIEGVGAEVRTSRSSGLHQRDELLEIGGTDRLEGPARELAGLGCGCVAWACTSGSFIGGLDWSERQRDELAAATGLPTTSTSLAIVAAARHLRAPSVDLLGPYPEPVTGALKGLLEEAGISVPAMRSLNSPSGPDSFRLDLRREAAAMPAGPADRPVVIPDTACNTLDLLTDLERILGRPVITAVQATLWHALVLLGLHPHAPDAGRLFQPA